MILRDAHIRRYILKRRVSGCELQVVQRVLDMTEGKYFVYGYEYECCPGFSQYGKGDVVLTDGDGGYMVVECKYLDYDTSGPTARTKRTKHRSKVQEQSVIYMKKLKDYLEDNGIEWNKVVGMAVVNLGDKVEVLHRSRLDNIQDIEEYPADDWA